MSAYLQKIIGEIEAERQYQERRWSLEFDDKNDLDNWIRSIVAYCSRASSSHAPPAKQRRDMLKVAAIAVAACEAFDRNGNFPPRHYEDAVAKD
jgi:hypothetical protein